MSYYDEKAPLIEPVIISDRNNICSKSVNANDEHASAVASITISHNVIRRHLTSVINKAPTVGPVNQEAFLKYAGFAAWHIKAYLKSSHHLFETLHECSSLLPYLKDFEHQLAIAPVVSDSLPLESDAWTGRDIADAAERLADVLVPHLERREVVMMASARGMPIRAFREVQCAMEREIKDSKVGNKFAQSMIAAHQTKAEAALSPSMSRMVGGMMYGRWTKFAK